MASREVSLFLFTLKNCFMSLKTGNFFFLFFFSISYEIKQLCKFSSFCAKRRFEPKPERNLPVTSSCERSFQVLDSCSFIKVLCVFVSNFVRLRPCRRVCISTSKRPKSGLNQFVLKLNLSPLVAENSFLQLEECWSTKVKEQRKWNLLQRTFEREGNDDLLCVFTIHSPALIK